MTRSSVWLAAYAIGGLAADGHIRPRQYDPEQGGDCTELSFSFPVWNIYDPLWTRINASTGGIYGDFRFGVHSTTTTATVSCLARNINLFPNAPVDVVWQSCNDSSTEFWPNLTANVFELKQRWSCADANSSTTHFVGSRTVPLPIDLGCYNDADSRGATTTCLLADLGIEVNLLSPIRLSPVIPQRPYQPYFRPTTCSERSQDPAWLIENLSLIPNRAAVDSTTQSTNYILSLNLTNWSNEERISCSALVDNTTLDQTLSERWLDCKSEPKSSKISSTRVMFDKDYKILGVNQIWNCDAPPGTQSYNGTGISTTPLNCSVSVPIHDDDAPLSYYCTMPAWNLTGWSDAELPAFLPHTLYTSSCTINSLNSTSLTLKGYEIGAAVAGSKAPQLGSFTLFNHGSGDEYGIKHVVIQDDGRWHDCAGRGTQMPWQLVSCQYLLDRGGGNIGFQIQWYCDDRDPGHAILFGAMATGKIPAEECWNSTRSAVAEVCGLPRSSASVELGLTGLSWNTTSGPMGRGPPLPWV